MKNVDKKVYVFIYECQARRDAALMELELLVPTMEVDVRQITNAAKQKRCPKSCFFKYL
jgi:hypothetical protein